MDLEDARDEAMRELLRQANLYGSLPKHPPRRSPLVLGAQKVPRWVPLHSTFGAAAAMLACTLTKQQCDCMVRQLNLQNALLAVLTCVPRAVEHPRKRWLDPSHPVRLEMRPTERLVCHSPIGDSGTVGLVDVNPTVVPFALKHVRMWALGDSNLWMVELLFGRCSGRGGHRDLSISLSEGLSRYQACLALLFSVHFQGPPPRWNLSQF
mmetsp:Transcript_46675/g.122579  ORF Transcript_46675/g.122579 Transcript_46675/m.122579 type:complete len:209 (-) Transcript_46675:720-1346(-)